MRKEEIEYNIHLRNILLGKEKGVLTGKPNLDKPHLKFYSEEALLDELPQNTMYGYLREQNKMHMSNTAICFDAAGCQKEITYQELFDYIERVASNLAQSGIQENDKVAVCFANIPESVYVIYALNKIGAVSCLIDPRITPKAMERDLLGLNVKMFIGIYECYKTFKKANERVGLKNYIFVPTLHTLTKKSVKALYTLSKVASRSVPFRKEQKWKTLCKKSDKTSRISEYQQNKLALISYTGGTTGVHKGVKLSNDALNTLVHSHKYIMLDIVKRGDIFMDILPQFMIYGIFSLHLSLCLGLKTYLLIDSSPEKFAENLIRINPTMVFGGPVHWETLIGNKKIKPNCLSNMKAPVSGGEKLPLQKEKLLDDILIYAGSQETMCNGYGASELGGSVTLKHGKHNKAGTVGRLHIFDNAKIISTETGEELAYNEIGELYITTPSLMMGYYNHSDEEEKAIITDQNGIRWFATGDMARIDENGDIELAGRKKRLFVCGINNVYPPEMEELINTLPNVKKCAVVNVPDEKLREVPKVHIVLEHDDEKKRTRAISQINKYIAENIGDKVVPKYFEFHEELLYTANGKIDFEAMRKKDIENMGKEYK